MEHSHIAQVEILPWLIGHLLTELFAENWVDRPAISYLCAAFFFTQIRSHFKVMALTIPSSRNVLLSDILMSCSLIISRFFLKSHLLKEAFPDPLIQHFKSSPSPDSFNPLFCFTLFLLSIYHQPTICVTSLSYFWVLSRGLCSFVTESPV